MTTVLCTLYNSLYLDKGLVLYDSLCECAKDFKLYVLCMDEKCYEVLTDLKQEHHIPVRLADFEAGDEELMAAKANRPMGEYCWTCSSSFIRYVLKHFEEDNCTYVDADMYFYNDPKVLIDDMKGAGKSVMVVPHRFPEEKKELAKKVGAYCVEFNTFLNTPESLEVLDYWRIRCLDSCKNLGDGVHWGDQKYLDELVEKFDCVYVCKHPGAGVAPWNFSLYNYLSKPNMIIFGGVNYSLVFVHFQGITYLTSNVVSTGVRKKAIADTTLIRHIYKEYLKAEKNKNAFLLSSYSIDCMLRNHPSDKQRLVPLKKTKIGSLLRLLLSIIRNQDIIIAA